MYRILLIIIIIIISYIFLFNLVDHFNNKQFDMERDIIPKDSKYVQNESIEFPIPDAYLTYYLPIDSNNIYDYKIISEFRNILGRPPTSEEIKLYRFKLLTGEVDEIFMRTILYNSTEYEYMKETQLNEVEHTLEFNTHKKMLFEIITNLYMLYHKDEIYENMLEHLRSILIHFQFDMYLFIAFLSSKKYIPFQTEVLETDIINKYVLREIFYKHFILLELHNIANAIKQEDLKNGKSSIFKNIFDGQKALLDKNREDMIKAKEEEERRRLAEIAKGNCDLPVKKKKIYNPISHNLPYKTNIAHNPPICTSLGDKFKYKSNNEISNYTTIEQSKDTVIGSIMPNFKYQEYVEQITQN
jgi:hypothetical protein